MTAGVEIYDVLGNLKVGLTTPLLRVIGTVIVGPGPASGTIVDDGFLTGTPFLFATMHSPNGATYWPADALYPPTFSFSGNTLSWSLTAGQPTVRLQYGVF